MAKNMFFKDSVLELSPSSDLWVQQVFFVTFCCCCHFPLQELKNEVWEYSSHVMCFINDQLLGDALDLQKWAHKVWDIVDFKPPALYDALTVDYSAKFLRATKASYMNF